MQCEAVIVSRTKAVMHIRSIRLSTVVVAACIRKLWRYSSIIVTLSDVCL